MAGTTVAAAGQGDQVGPAMIEAMSRFGLPISAKEIDSVRGASKRDAIQQLLLTFAPELATQEAIDQAFEAFKANLAARQQKEGVKAMEGAEEAFNWLKARQIKIALTTGFDRQSTERVIGTLGWKSGIADAIVCADDVKTGRPAPYLIFHAMEIAGASSVAKVAVVGDTVMDLQAGANAGVAMNIGVLSGAHKREQLEAEPHTHLIDSVKDLVALL
jgi:phosphonatase-like hydrolase